VKTLYSVAIVSVVEVPRVRSELRYSFHYGGTESHAMTLVYDCSEFRKLDISYLPKLALIYGLKKEVWSQRTTIAQT